MAKLPPEALERLKERTLVLTQTEDPETDTMFGAWVADGLHAGIVFRECPKPVRAVRRLWVDGILPGASAWYGPWKGDLDRYDTVILHASERMRTVPRWIHARRPGMRIIYWYWNPVNKESLPELAMTPGMECWSFDPADCERYGMRRNIQYYFVTPGLEEVEPEYDVYFIGHDKSRGAEVRRVQRALEDAGLTTRVDLLGEHDRRIPYSEVQRRVAKARAILEINQEGQSGYTLRALESIFLGRKLITNNALIRHEDFYRPENVLVLGEGRDIRAFVDGPSVDVSAYRDEYDIDSWFSRFFMG